MTYIDFLRSKVVTAPETGFTISDSDINPELKPHQRDAVKWAVAGGRRGLFERFGLGKTVQELEYCRIVTEHEGGKALIVLPLGVRQEFAHDAVQLHVCPLQLDIVDRIINRYSNPGDLVFDPFGGLGMVPLEAMKAGRRGYMCELNPDYFRDAVGYLKAEEEKQEAPTLFDLLGEG